MYGWETPVSHCLDAPSADSVGFGCIQKIATVYFMPYSPQGQIFPRAFLAELLAVVTGPPWAGWSLTARADLLHLPLCLALGLLCS